VARTGGRRVAKNEAALPRNAFVFLLSALIIGACTSSGGGTRGGSVSIGSGSGTGGGMIFVPPPPPTAASFRTAEYLSSWALDAIEAAEAYALGYTGEGVTIGVVDFTFDFSSTEVDYGAASVGPDPQAIEWYKAVFGEDSVDDIQHGHAVAATAAALKNGDEIHGVAFDANVLAVDFFANVNATEVQQDGFTFHVSDPWTYLTSRGVKIINKSYGFDDGDSVEIPGSVTDLYVHEPAVTAIANGALLVASAGNQSGPNPILSNREIVDDILANDLEDGPGAFMIVGSVKQAGGSFEISDFSNRAGTYADYFLVAPGEDVVFPLNDPACAPSFLCVGSGTSFSAPIVSGAAALVLERWPQLTAREIADVLFASATDLGDPGPDNIYGQGMLNVFAALQPIGVTTLDVENGAAFSVESTAMVLGPAFGDAPQLRTALQAVPIRDSFSRDFGIDLSGLVSSAPRTNLAGIMEQRLRWHGAAFHLGTTGGIAVQLYDDKDVPFQALNGMAEPDRYRGVVQFNGQSGAFAWTAGSGLGLGTALANRSEDAGIAPLTRAFSNMLETQTGYFATARVALNERTNLSFGISQARDGNYAGHALPALDEGMLAHAAAMRLDYAAPLSDLSFEVGSALEEGAVLGSFGAGALSLSERSASVWTRVGGEKRLGENWLLRVASSLALTKPTPGEGYLVASFGPILSTTTSLGFARKDLFAPGDALSFTLYQPLRAERAQMTLFTAGRDQETGLAASRQSEITLIPSGREIAFELGYSGRIGAWNAEANLAYRHDAGHFAGIESGAVMLWLSRWL